MADPAGANRPRGELAERWERLHERAERKGLHVYPGWPGDLPTAPWPGDAGRLVDLAAALEARLVYVVAEVFDRPTLEQYETRVAEAGGDAEDSAALARAQRRLDEICGIHCGFVHEGVLHHASERAGWLTELQQRLELGRITDFVSRESERARYDELRRLLRRQADELAVELAEDAAFARARNEDGRRAAAEAHPVVGAALALRGHPDTVARTAYQAALDVLRAATREFRTRVKPQAEAALRDRLDELAAELAADLEFAQATTKPERLRIAGRAVEAELGWKAPTLATRLEQQARRERGWPTTAAGQPSSRTHGGAEDPAAEHHHGHRRKRDRGHGGRGGVGGGRSPQRPG